MLIIVFVRGEQRYAAFVCVSGGPRLIAPLPPHKSPQTIPKWKITQATNMRNNCRGFCTYY